MQLGEFEGGKKDVLAVESEVGNVGSPNPRPNAATDSENPSKTSNTEKPQQPVSEIATNNSKFEQHESGHGANHPNPPVLLLEAEKMTNIGEIVEECLVNVAIC